MAKTVLGAPSTLTPDEVIGPTDTPSTSAPASSQWVSDIADKALSKDTDVLADIDTATPTDTNKVPNAADVKAKLDEKLDAKIAETDVMMRTDVDGNIVASSLTAAKAEALESLSEAKIPTIDADGKLVDSALTKAKAEALEALSTESALVTIDANGEVAEAAISFDSTANRASQTAAPAATADADTDLMTKKDTDALYAVLNKPVASFDIDSDVESGGFIPFTGNEIKINKGFTVQDGTDATDKFLRFDTAGIYRITFSGLGYSTESKSGTAATANSSGSIVFNKSSSVSGTAARFHQIRWYSNPDESYKPLSATIVQSFAANEVLSITVSGLAVYGSNGDYSAVNVEYIRPA